VLIIRFMKYDPFIVKRRSLLKGGLLILVWLGAAAFSFPFKIREKLSRLPYVGRFFKEESPPEDLKKKTLQTLEEAYWEGAPFYTPDLWEKARKYYDKGLKAFSEEKYSHARFYFEKAIDYAKKARQETLKQQQELKDKAEKRFAKIVSRWKEVRINPRERLKWEVRLRYLRELLEAKRYKEFFKVADDLEKELARLPKKERAPEGPSPSTTN